VDATPRHRVRSLFRALGVLVAVAIGVPLVSAAVASAATPAATTFAYSGAVADYTVPAGVHYVVVDAWGAGTGNGGGHAGGTIPVTPGEVLRVRVGGANGFNGGGAGGPYGGNGGGATDVRQGGDTLADRVVIAGGSGGGGANTCCSGIFSEPVAGAGGGPHGADGGGDANACGGCPAYGGTQNAGGASPACGNSGTIGQGADGCGGGGGGGGLYGGGGNVGFADTSPSCLPNCGGYGAGGGGGSGYVTPSAYAARNEVGDNLGNGHASIRPAAVPQKPTIAVFLPGNGRVPLGWSPPANNDLPITGYTIKRYQGFVLQQTVLVGPTTLSYTFTGLTNGQTYGFTVAASNAVGTGAAPGPVSVRVGTPWFSRLPAVSPGNGSLTVSWQSPVTNGSAVTRYILTPYRSGVAQTKLLFGPSATSATLGGLTNGDSYAFTIAATNANGTGPPSSPSVAANVGGPTAPRSVSASAGGCAFQCTAVVQWVTPANDNGSDITSYVVTPYLAGVAQPVQTFSASTRSAIVWGETGKTYTYMVAAKNARGVGGQSAPTGPVTLGVPAAPGSPKATPGNASATVNWTAPNPRAAPITAYIVTPYVGGGAQAPRVYNSTATTQVVTGLTNGTTYTFKVAARNTYGTGAQSVTSNAVTPS